MVQSRFFGREAELGELFSRLDDGEGLIVVKAVGGAGKTRLVRELVRSLAGDALPRAGVFWCDLADCRSSNELCGAVARSLGVPLASRANPALELGDAIAARGDALLVLDNFEQLDPPCVEVLAHWNAVAPEASFIVTSRRRLALDAQSLIELEPLPVPALEQTADAIRGSPSVQLFIERAARARPGYRMRDEEAPIVAEIVRALDGLPLAIELAAAKMHVLGPAELRANLIRRFELLEHAAVGMPARHTRLRTAIEWSLDLLGEQSRRALACCSVFRGGFSPEAASAVLEQDALAVLQTLQEHSLITSSDAPRVAGERRHSLFESVRELAAEELDARGDGKAVRSRHADYFHRLAIGASHGRRELELENLLAALDTLEKQRDVRAIELLLALEPVFLSQGPLARFVELLDRALERAIEPEPAIMLSLLRARGWAMLVLGRARESVVDLERALGIADRMGDRALRVATRGRLGMAAMLAGRDELAEQSFREGLALIRQGVLPAVAVGLRKNHANFLIQIGRIDEARAALELALADAVADNDERHQAIVLTSLGDLQLGLARVEQAVEHYRRALLLAIERGDRRVEGQIRTSLAFAMLEQGALDEARAELDRAFSIHRAVGNRLFEANAHAYSGLLCFVSGDAEQACRDYARSLALVTLPRGRGLVLAALALAEAWLDRVDAAREHLRAARELLAAGASHHDRHYLELARMHVRVAELRRSESAGELDPLDVEDRVRALLAESKARPIRTYEARIAARMLEALIARPSKRSSSAPAARDVLMIAIDGTWFERTGQPRIELRRHRALRSILTHLAERRVASPGKPSPLEAVRQAGWPNEKILPRAAQNRVYVALSRLRQLGLRDTLISKDEGWLITPDVHVELVPSGQRAGSPGSTRTDVSPNR